MHIAFVSAYIVFTLSTYLTQALQTCPGLSGWRLWINKNQFTTEPRLLTPVVPGTLEDPVESVWRCQQTETNRVFKATLRWNMADAEKRNYSAMDAGNGYNLYWKPIAGRHLQVLLCTLDIWCNTPSAHRHCIFGRADGSKLHMLALCIFCDTHNTR